MQYPHPLKILPALVFTLALAACGGGSDEAAEPETASDHAESAGEAPEPADAREDALASTSTTITATCGLSGFQSEALQRINVYRARGASCGSRGSFAPTSPLAWHAALNSAVARHSKDMQARNFFSHTGSDGSNPGKRMTQAGYAWTWWGENIAAGHGSVRAVVDGWMASPGHCANIMKPQLREIGLACVKGGTANAYRTYWTMDLGRR